MKPVCEIIVQEILPSVRAMVAVKLTNTYGLSQEQAAVKMGTSQPAISQYKREIRGHKSRVFKQNPKLAEMAFTTGLLHDVGKLVLAANLPELYAKALRLQTLKQLPLRSAEQVVLGTTHAQLGACQLAVI